MRILSLIIFALIISNTDIYAQSIELKANNIPLNKVLTELRDNYNLQFSFNDELLSKYKVNSNKTFNNKKELIEFLLKDLPLDYEINNNVIIIFPATVIKKSEYIITGTVRDEINKEALPYANLIINNHGLITDLQGNFKYISKKDSIFNLKISYLGYYIVDTTVIYGNNLKFNLTPSTIGLQEIVLVGNRIEFAPQIGNTAGAMRINHKIATFLPGNGNNSVYNLLRLQPGILATGESSKDFIIWGSYKGHSKIYFDGISIYGMTNFNDNISTINPFLVKDIMVLKGGFGVEYGECVGGVVNILGKNGNYSKFKVDLNIDNYTVNSKINIPILKNSALQIAFRKTYYDLYNQFDLSIKDKSKENTEFVDLNIIPDYSFYDYNIKYSGHTNNNSNYYISFLNANDKFSYSTEIEKERINIDIEKQEKNSQKGINLYFDKIWKNGNKSSISQSYSSFQKTYSTERNRVNLSDEHILFSNSEGTDNSIKEYKSNFKTNFVISEYQEINSGVSFTTNEIYLREDSANYNFYKNTSYTNIINAYTEEKLKLPNKISIDLGVRLDYSFDLKKLYPQPRIKLNYPIYENWIINAAWGMYKQLITEASIVDNLGNYRYFWAECNNDEIPVLSAQHQVFGIKYSKNNFIVSIEAYKKTTNGITRYLLNKQTSTRKAYYGEGISKGIDFFIKKEYKGHSAWISYTLSKTLESFGYRTKYIRAPHDQLHEFKTAVLINLSPIYLSANYVFGSGFPDPTPLKDDDILADIPYNRLDAAIMYKLPVKKINMNIGASVLNVLNTENIKLSNLERVPLDQLNSINFYSEAVPFTPTILLNLSF